MLTNLGNFQLPGLPLVHLQSPYPCQTIVKLSLNESKILIRYSHIPVFCNINVKTTNILSGKFENWIFAIDSVTPYITLQHNFNDRLHASKIRIQQSTWSGSCRWSSECRSHQNIMRWIECVCLQVWYFHSWHIPLSYELVMRMW